MKQKTGRKLLAFLLTLAMVFGLVPGMSLTALAINPNELDDPFIGGVTTVAYASLKNTTTVITFDGKQWYLIDYDASTVTLLAKECVGLSVFGSNTTYSGSTVETYVNNWYSDNISTNAKTMVSGGMFLLTLEQVNTIASTSTDVLLCEVPNGADARWWWLSTPGTGNNCVSCVYGDNASVLNYGYEYSYLFGVRPALKLDLSKVSFDSTSNTFMLPTVAVTSVTLDPATASMTVGGDAVALTAAVAPDNATDKKVVWSVGGTDTGEVKLYTDEACTTEVGANATDKLTVYAKGVSAGTATVTATSNADANKSASCAVTVTDPLADAKTSAKADLDTLQSGKNQNDYDAADWTTLTQAITDGKTSIDNATTTDAVATAKNIAVDAVNAVKTKAQKALENAKTSAVNTVNAVNANDYIAADQQTVTDAKTTALAAIEAATTEEEVTTALNNFNNAIASCTTQVVADQIAQVMSEVSAKTGSDMTYTGSPIQLINTPTTALPAGYTMKYAVTTENVKPTDESLYTTSIPTKTNAGTYYVWYKAVGDANHNDSAASCVQAIILAPKSVKVTFKVVNGAWDDGTTADKTVTLTGFEGDTLNLAAADIPAVGSKPDDTYKAGKWDVSGT